MLRRALISVLLVIAARGTARAETGSVLVFPFENLSNDRSLDWIGEGIAELMVQRLQSLPGFYVFTRSERLDAYEKLGIPESTALSRATQLKLAWEIGADKIIASLRKKVGPFVQPSTSRARSAPVRRTEADETREDAVALLVVMGIKRPDAQRGVDELLATREDVTSIQDIVTEYFRAQQAHKQHSG